MQELVNAIQMKAIDTYSIHTLGIPSLVLMEQAAKAVADVVMDKANREEKIQVVCGMGNNGADGIAVARLLSISGYQVEIFYLGNEKHASNEWKIQQNIVKNLGIPFSFYLDNEKEFTKQSDWIIDAIFGIGLSRKVEGVYAKIIEAINQSKAKVISVDIASGLCADDGKILGIAIKAWMTVTFGYKKAGMLLYPGITYSGEVKVADIGFPRIALQKVGLDTYAITKEEIKTILDLRPQNSHKGTFGKVLIIAGSRNMAGAAAFSAKAAYRMGCGLVKVYTPEENRIIIQNLVPEAILSTYDSMKVINKDEILKELSWANVVVLGPGLGQSTNAEILVETVLENYKLPLVIDADALRILARINHYSQFLTGQMILTPHLGEFSALLDMPIEEIEKQKLKLIRSWTKETKSVWVMKDAKTLIGDGQGKVYINTSGCSALATAGSGDVLTGVIAGLLAMSISPKLAAPLGVFIHARAGEFAARDKSEASVMARDLIEYLGKVLMER